ncbi:ABC transporter permease [Tenggerimyces flavus]|uniref:ABC transporter permease n=1 Tax=Tenggerimyces flavus TaxID=1708749 RepID=A0ABV7YMG8_9ACTN|nr:ABC transporter permease [Tenggerimyces flavus]MBM7789667.1 peptide/nickel transport system permease protein [Tenggerimyces flavus]
MPTNGAQTASPSARDRDQGASRRASGFGVVRQLAAFLVRAVLRTVLMLWLVASVTFLAIRALPGNPVDVWVQDMQGTGMTAAQAEKQATRLLNIDVNESLWSQYVSYLNNLLRGDLGQSVILSPGTPVSEMIGDRLGWTLFSVGFALIIGFFIGLYLGGIAAYRRGSWLDRVITNGSALMDSIPPVLLGILLTFYLSVVWDLVPVQNLRGAYSPDVQPGPNLDFVLSALAHVIAPGTVYILTSVGAWALIMRSSALSVLGDDYVKQGRARGLSERTIRVSYVQRNARLPLVTGFAISMGFVVSGSVLVEEIFVYPGVGQLLADALARRDYTVMQGVVIATTITVLIATAVADALYGWLDPRTRIEVSS